MDHTADKNRNSVNEECKGIKSFRLPCHFLGISVFGWIIILTFFSLGAHFYCRFQ